MRKRLTTLALVAAASVALATAAQAHLVAHPRCASLHCRAQSQHTNLLHARYVCRQGGGHHRWWSCKAVPWLTREYKQTLAALSPPVAAVPHLQGWLCIHNGEGSWDSQTGNGYYGGLQMTYGWMGLVVNAALLSPRSQMLAAETGYRNSGYSDPWMQGQWPNTYPPCASYFH